MMKERFAKLLLGEDMSGGGKGVCTALAISNAITNLCGKKKMLSFILLLICEGFIFIILLELLLSQPQSLGNCGGWSLLLLRRRQCGEGRSSGFCVSVIT